MGFADLIWDSLRSNFFAVVIFFSHSLHFLSFAPKFIHRPTGLDLFLWGTCRMADDSGMQEILGIFFEEVSQNVEELERLFLGLGVDADNNEFKVMFRIAHNIKGSSKSVGMANMGRVTHELETLLIKLGEGAVRLSAEMLTVLLKSLDALKDLISEAQATGADGLSVDSIVQEIKTIQQNAYDAQVASLMNAAQDGDIIFITEPVISKGSDEVENPTEKTEIKSMGNGVVADAPGTSPVSATESATESATKPAEVSVKPLSSQSSANSGGVSKNTNETVRVPTQRIDRLQNHVGEILVLQSVLSEQLRDHPSPLVRNALRQMKKVTREVQDDSMGLRLVSLKSLFMKLTRAVHDAAGALAKHVEFVTIGEDTEVDKVLSEGLADPLMHMVRNAVDHGQEKTEERIAAGKNQKGKIELSARSEGAFLVVRLKDDGKGLDVDAILEKARSKGMISNKQELTEKQIFALIFQPSFSTKAVVTEVSGRGVGMDVVQTNVHAMRGHIDIESAKGKGTTFTINIPLAISLLDGMIVQLGSGATAEKWILPLHMVVESFRFASCHIAPLVGVGEVMTLREENIPIVDLAQVLQMKTIADPANRVVIVAKDKDVKVALVVDTVLGIQTLVSKPLTAEMQAKPGISGCAILGDGKTALILEVASLHRNHSKNSRRAA